MAHPWKEQLDRLRKNGATYADVRYYPREDSLALVMRNGNLLSFESGGQRGFGVRVLADGAWGFAASSELQNIQAVFDQALSNARAAATRLSRPIRLADKQAHTGQFASPCQVDPLGVSYAEQVDFLQRIDRALNQTGVEQRTIFLETQRKTIEYYDTEGARIVKDIREIFPYLDIQGKDADGEAQSRRFSPPRIGGSRGWEIMRADYLKPKPSAWCGSSTRRCRRPAAPVTCARSS